MTLDPALARDIVTSVDEGFDGQVAWLRDLVRHPSLRGREHMAQEMVHGALAARGYGMDRWAIDVDQIRDHPGFITIAVDYANAVNVVGTHMSGKTRGRSLILNGHIDVVPAGPREMWSRDPFDPVIEGDWMYGRGAGDMKAGIAANIFAVNALSRLGHEPAATLYHQSVTEEECTGNGALSCLVRGYRTAFDADLTSGTSTAYLDGRVFMLYDDCPALVYGPMSQNIHGFDERVSLSSLRQVTTTVALSIADWCGLNRI